jgi:hypothetical protein
MVQMCRRQDDSGGSEADGFDQVRPAARSPLPRPPGLHLRIMPAPVGKASHDEAVRAATNLAATLCPLKTNDTAHLGPIGWVEIAKVMADRHWRRLIDRFRAGQHPVLAQEALQSIGRKQGGNNDTKTLQMLSGIRKVKRVSAGVELTVSVPPCARAISEAI